MTSPFPISPLLLLFLEPNPHNPMLPYPLSLSLWVGSSFWLLLFISVPSSNHGSVANQTIPFSPPTSLLLRLLVRVVSFLPTYLCIRWTSSRDQYAQRPLRSQQWPECQTQNNVDSAGMGRRTIPSIGIAPQYYSSSTADSVHQPFEANSPGHHAQQRHIGINPQPLQ